MRTRWILAAFFVLAGTVWVLQGLGILRGSGFMVGDRTWAIAGAGLIVLGLAVGWTAFRGRRRA
ncbi:MAG TPA: hypothetical protein VF119_04040 [Candidatus Limnocylindrales bacterium]